MSTSGVTTVIKCELHVAGMIYRDDTFESEEELIITASQPVTPSAAMAICIAVFPGHHIQKVRAEVMPQRRSAK